MRFVCLESKRVIKPFTLGRKRSPSKSSTVIKNFETLAADFIQVFGGLGILFVVWVLISGKSKDFNKNNKGLTLFSL